MTNSKENISQSEKISLISIVGEKYVNDEDFIRRSYNRAPTWGRGEQPAIVVRPGTSEEVSKIVKFANQQQRPIIPRGGGASSPLGGFPKTDRVESSILLDMTRMNRFLYLDEENMVAAAETGIVLSDISFPAPNRVFTDC